MIVSHSIGNLSKIMKAYSILCIGDTWPNVFEEGAMMICEALKTNSALVSLDLSRTLRRMKSREEYYIYIYK